MPLTTTLVVTLIGLAAIPMFPVLGDIEADRVMPALLSAWSEAGPMFAVAAVVVVLGALAAFMSTADSCLLSLGSSLADDVLDRRGNRGNTAAFGKRAAAGVMVAMAALAVWARDVTLWGLIELKMELLIQCVPAFVIALHWSRLRAVPTLCGLLVGCAIVGVGLSLGISRVGGLHVGVIALVANAAIATSGSLAMRPLALRAALPGSGP
jgi:Na+/proline symporter